MQKAKPNKKYQRIKITKTFDNKDVHHAPVTVVLKGPTESEDNLTILVESPLFNDPKDPGGLPGQPFDTIWEYEVVEVFLLNDQDNYLEVILSPHGQHYVLIQGGYRNKLKVEMPIEYTTTKEESRWSGKAIIPGSYLPPKVTKWNVYAMHGTGEARQFESLHGDVNGKHEKPDFHDLSLFGPIDMGRILPNNWSLEYNTNNLNAPYRQKLEKGNSE
ncbi:UPF0462 protein C4orf33 homolog,UPF0462 protein C4orf33 [Mytilus edulis]|uniref:UPF0462 protein C4orf33 homolog,UPF0462 protein C4orf33 n=1 Tax=Mytilus edulis TaxID=6550 RepID=A0A8S3PXK4_MYTED|nr:UPF0462 protein C4orf33 homolog,UPF0462 protein C4orf33 [Mytilus edulis]